MFKFFIDVFGFDSFDQGGRFAKEVWQELG
jgi:hypothetical protein